MKKKLISKKISIHNIELFCRGSRRLGNQELWLFLQRWRDQFRKPGPSDPRKGGQHYKGTEGGYPEYQLSHPDPHIGFGSQTFSPGGRMRRDRDTNSCVWIIGLAWSHQNLLQTEWKICGLTSNGKKNNRLL